MINVNGLKRNAKNIVKKYTDAQIKVREATSNDPWGPSSTIMAEIADLTYNVVAFSEIMQMIWKRLNDHGKNWRHVYKALVLLEYLIKTGTEKVAQQCTENIFAIQTLKDFQYMEENKDHGMNIREKSKKLVALLKDSEKLKAERARAIKAKSRLAESMSSVSKSSMRSMMSRDGSSGSGDATASSTNNGNNFVSSYSNDSGSSSSGTAHLPNVGGLAIPQNATEEENQLKLALALSKEEAEQQEKTRKNDELRLKLALDVSKKTASSSLFDELTEPSTSAAVAAPAPVPAPAPTPSKSTIDDLLGLSIPPPEPQNDPWSNDPWQTMTSPSATATSTITNTSTNPLSNQLTNPLSNQLTNPLSNQLTNPLSNQLITNPIIAPTPLTIDNNFFNKKPASKNPFED